MCDDRFYHRTRKHREMLRAALVGACVLATLIVAAPVFANLNAAIQQTDRPHGLRDGYRRSLSGLPHVAQSETTAQRPVPFRVSHAERRAAALPAVREAIRGGVAESDTMERVTELRAGRLSAEVLWETSEHWRREALRKRLQPSIRARALSGLPTVIMLVEELGVSGDPGAALWVGAEPLAEITGATVGEIYLRRGSSTKAAKLKGGGAAATVFLLGKGIVALYERGDLYGVYDALYGPVVEYVVTEAAVRGLATIGSQAMTAITGASVTGPVGVVIVVGATIVVEASQIAWHHYRALGDAHAIYIARCDAVGDLIGIKYGEAIAAARPTAR